MNEVVEDLLQKRYDEIMKKLDGGYLYGEKINKYDIRMIVVAAYVVGELEYSGTWWKTNDNHSIK